MLLMLLSIVFVFETIKYLNPKNEKNNSAPKNGIVNSSLNTPIRTASTSYLSSKQIPVKKAIIEKLIMVTFLFEKKLFIVFVY